MKQDTDRKILELLNTEHVLSARDAMERLGVSGASQFQTPVGFGRSAAGTRRNRRIKQGNGPCLSVFPANAMVYKGKRGSGTPDGSAFEGMSFRIY